MKFTAFTITTRDGSALYFSREGEAVMVRSDDSLLVEILPHMDGIWSQVFYEVAPLVFGYSRSRPSRLAATGSDVQELVDTINKLF